MINVKEEVIMKKSKWLALLMAATMVMGVMTGCGGGDTNAPATGVANTTATTEKKDEKKDDKKDSKGAASLLV